MSIRFRRFSIRSSAKALACWVSRLRRWKSPRSPTFRREQGSGSSGSFTTALLKALYTHRRRYLNQVELAELACHVEIDRLGEPIGKQDQYIAAVGGVTCFTFHRGRHCDGLAACGRAWTRCSILKTTCFSSSPGSRAAPARSSRIRIRARSRATAEMLEQPPLREGARLSQQGSARKGQFPSLRRD